MEIVKNVLILPVITSLPVPVELVLSGAMAANLDVAIVVGVDKEGQLYFASSEPDGGTVLWWMEKAKIALMEISE